jgi:MFS family permease
MPSRQRKASRDAPAAGPPLRRPGGSGWALAVAAAILVLTIDDRHVGSVADGRQMIWTAVAITETGEISQARERDFTFGRPRGDAVSRYGMGMSIAQLPAAWLAPKIEQRRGAGSSQPLFLVAPLFFTLVAAYAAGRIAEALGGGGSAVAAAILLASVASPLGSYAAMEFSEPMQAAALAVTLWMALESRGLAAGSAAGVALLAKSANLVVAPLLLVPLLKRRIWMAPAASFALFAAVWLVFEIIRFGAPLANYPNEGFTNPVWDGIWRLLVSPTKGLLLVWPAALIAVIASTRRLPKYAALTASAVLLVLAAAYWGWHGNEGWGPRLALPAVPLLAPLAAIQLERWGRSATVAVVALCLLINLPPLVQHPTPISTYVTNLEWPRVSEEELYGIPGYARQGESVSPDLVLAKVPAANPWMVHWWFMRATWASPEASARLLRNPPWLDARPDLRLRHEITPALARYFTREPRWSFWGRGFSPSPGDAGYRAVYLEGLEDQVVKLQQQRRGAASLRLARKLYRLDPGGEAVALVLESQRLLGETEAARTFLTSQPLHFRLEPKINVVLALFERDAGNEAGARAFLTNAAPYFQGAPIQEAVGQPLSRWPPDLFGMTARPVGQVDE